METWERFFAFLRKDGVNAIRLFPRGDSGGSAWEGLDVGGRVNRSLLELILLYAKTARRYGIRTMLGLFTQPECSVYCRKDTRVYWGQRLFDDEMRREATPSQRRFLDNADDLVSYGGFFTDPDVRSCCHSFLDEILPLLSGNPDLFALELYNEMGWASPNAEPQNTFRWELTDAYLDWSRDMADHVRRGAPDLCLTISNPGVGLLGHDPVQWMRAIQPDLFSFHNYPDICGALPGMDYAAVSDMCLKYTSLAGPAMMGEWQADTRPVPEDEELLRLNARDFCWMTVLSGAPGCVSWRARNYGQSALLLDLLDRLERIEGRDLTRAVPSQIVNVSDAYACFVSLADAGERECRLSAPKWCPDWQATDGMHRFCVKAESAYHRKMLEIERRSLETGADYDFSLTDGKPLLDWSDADFTDDGTVGVPAGYHAKTLSSADGETAITYLRNFEPVRFWHPAEKDEQKVEKFCIRRAIPRPVTLEFRDPAFLYELLDLDNGERCVLPAGRQELGVTSHDYAVTARRIRAKSR